MSTIRKLRKTAFGSVDAVAHRHFQDPLDAVESLIEARAFVYALETTEDASSLFDIVFPLPPPPVGSSSRSDSVGRAVGTREEIDDRGSLLASEALEGPSSRKGLLGKSEAFQLPEGGVVALVLGNEVTGVDERVLRRCDRVVEVRAYVVRFSYRAYILHRMENYIETLSLIHLYRSNDHTHIMVALED